MIKIIFRKLLGLMRTIFGWFAEGKGIRQTCKYLWKRLWQAIDRALGVFARWLIKRSTKVDGNKVFFHTQENRYACNQKYICEELRRRCPDIDIVWRDAKAGSGIPSDYRTVEAGSYEYFKEILTSKVVCTNSVLYVEQPVHLRRSQTLIETWHGSLGIKKFGKYDYKSNILWVLAAIKTGKMTDYCVTNSTFVSGSLRNTYWPKTPMLEYGHPRNDLFFENYAAYRAELRDRLCEEWGVSKDTRFVMYGPTFRDNKDFKVYNIDYDRLLQSLEQRFGGEWKILLRFHPSLAKKYSRMKKDDLDGKIIPVTDYIDMQELIAVSDVAISDYSSWIYDFMLLRRPGFIYAPDIAFYNNERGFCYPLETTPFPIAADNDELEDAIIGFDNDAYLEKLEAFLEDKGCVEDGHASERVVDKILEIMGKTSAETEA